MKRPLTLLSLLVFSASAVVAHGPDGGEETVAGHAVQEFMMPAAAASFLIVTVALAWIAYTHVRGRNA